MILLVDIGNSRVKWATSSRGHVDPQRTADYAGWRTEDWRREVFARPDRGTIERVLIGSVATAGARAAAAYACRSATGREPEFVQSTAAACGVRNGYPVPAQLGVDRWLAVIAAFSLSRRAVCVVDVGTAMTVDTVDREGRHHGGFIVPGPRLMVTSLLHGTGELADRWTWREPDGTTWFADNTRDAIERGCVLSLAGLVDASVARMQTAADAPALVVTGGAASALIPWLQHRAKLIPDLVLQGLARLAGTNTGKTGQI